MSVNQTSVYNRDSTNTDNQSIKVYKNKTVEKEKDTMGHEEVVQDRIYVSGFGSHIYEGDLFHFFSTFGDVRHVIIITENGFSRGYGFVTFSNKETARRLLQEKCGEGLFLNGKKLNIGAARQKYGSSPSRDKFFKGGQVQRSNWSSDNKKTTDLDKIPIPNDVLGEGKDIVEHPYQVVDHFPVGPPTQSYNPQFSPTTPSYNYQQYPMYYYPQDMSTYSVYPMPSQDTSWYYSNSQDITNVQGTGIHAYSTTFPTSTPTYPVSYFVSPSYPPLVPDNSMQQLPTPGYFWPQSPMYPVYYDTNQSTIAMIPNQLVTTGELQPDQSVSTFQDVSSNRNVFDAESINDIAVKANETLGDSGFQENSTSGQVLYSHSSYTDYDYDSTYQNTDTVGYQSQKNACLGMKKLSKDAPGNKSIDSRVHKINPNTKNDKNKAKDLLPSQDRKYTKLRSTDDTKYPARNVAAVDKFGKESRYYPSPYKSFVPFTGNPVPRRFPQPPGPRPYYQGRGRGKLWVGQTPGRGQASARNQIFQKENVKRKDASNNEIEDKYKNVEESQPDILQGPLEKLKLK